MLYRRVALLAIVGLALAPAPALAASGAHAAAAAVPFAGIIDSVFGGLGHALLGAFSWTVDLAGKFILTTLGALVRMLIPQSWVHKGLQIMQWLVAVPDYAGKVTNPGGGRSYGFAGINDLRDVMMWLGVAIAPLTLVYATARAMVDDSDPVAIPVLRMLAVAVVIISYPYWWSQASALTDQFTNSILTLPEVSRGLYKLMTYAVGGVALGGWQLIDLALMGAIGIALLSLIFLKVAVILVGALLYATGPLMIGLVPTRAGSALARAWASAVGFVFGLGIAWTLVFAVGALLIGDAGSAGPLIAGNSAFGSLAGGLLLAVAGLASLWLCLKAAKEASSILRMQLSGMLVLTGRHSARGSATSTTSTRGTTGASLREYGSRLTRSARAATGELALAGAGGAAAATAARSAAYVGRRGLVGTALGGARAGAQRAAAPATTVLTRTRAGAVAARMARAGTASWATPATTPPSPPPNQPAATTPPNHSRTTAAEPGRNGRNGRQPGPGPSKPRSPAKPQGASQSDTTSRPARSRPDRSPSQTSDAGANHPNRVTATPVSGPGRGERSRPASTPATSSKPAPAPSRRGLDAPGAPATPTSPGGLSSSRSATPTDTGPARPPRPAPTPPVAPQRPARPAAPKPPQPPVTPKGSQRPMAPKRSPRPAGPKTPEPPQRGKR
jgi:hypothetical protein